MQSQVSAYLISALRNCTLQNQPEFAKQLEILGQVLSSMHDGACGSFQHFHPLELLYTLCSALNSINTVPAFCVNVSGNANEPGLALALGCFQHAVKLRAMTGLDSRQYREVSAQAARLQSKMPHAASSSRGLQALQADQE